MLHLYPHLCRNIGDHKPHVGADFGGRMAKGDQRKEKMAKKPKKDTSEPKNSTSDRPMAPVTAVIPRGKDKNK